MPDNIYGALLANAVIRHRKGGSGVADLTTMVESLADSPLTPAEIASTYNDAFVDAEFDAAMAEVV